MAPVLMVAACSLVIIVALIRRALLHGSELPSVKSNVFGLDIIRSQATDPVTLIRQTSTRLGRIFELTVLFSTTTWLISPQFNKEYLETREDVWSFGDGMGKFLNHIVSPEYWPQLKTFVGSLSRGVTRADHLRRYQTFITPETVRSCGRWKDEGSIEIFDSVSHLVHRTIVRCLMGEDFYSQHVDEFFELLRTMEANLGSIWNFLLPQWIPHPAARQLWAARDRVDAIFQECIQARARNIEKWKDSGDYIAYTIGDPVTQHLQHLYSGHHTVIMFAAHTSTVSLIAWALIELAHSPTHLADLRASFDQCSSPTDSKYLDAVLKETIRRYTGMADIRVAKKAKTIKTAFGARENPSTSTKTASPRTIVVPAGRVVSVSPYLTHHDPSLFITPEKWEPRRWIDDPMLQTTVNNGDQLGFIPFGAGVHRCPGEKFAWMMAGTIVSNVIQNYDIHLETPNLDVSTNKLDFSKIGSPWLKGGLKVRLTRRVCADAVCI